MRNTMLDFGLAGLGKRIMPVAPGPLGDAKAPPGLAASLNICFLLSSPGIFAL
jgi:hypothetical protein